MFGRPAFGELAYRLPGQVDAIDPSFMPKVMTILVGIFLEQ